MGSLVFTDTHTKEYLSYDSDLEEDVLVIEECTVDSYYYYCDNCGSFALSAHMRPRIFWIMAIILVPSALFLTIFELWICVGLAFIVVTGAFVFDKAMGRSEYYRCEKCTTKWPTISFPKGNPRGYGKKDIPKSKDPDVIAQQCHRIN